MKKGLVFIILAMYGIMAMFGNSYKWKAQTGETRTRKDGTVFHVWDRMELSERKFNELKESDFKDARVIKREGITNYIIEIDGKKIIMTEIADGHVAGKGES